MMIDYIRENLSYYPMYYRMFFKVKKTITPDKVTFGEDKNQYFYYYRPKEALSDKVIVWIHGGGWNAGDPKFFDFMGQSVAGMGYHFISVGYRLSNKYKYPAQIEDVCKCYNEAIKYLKERGVDTSKVVVSGPSAGAHLSSIMCYSKKDHEKYNVDLSNVIGYIGIGGPYSFRDDAGLTIKLLLNMLFKKGYDRKEAEPVSLMCESNIPMLLIQSRHDGLIEFECAKDMAERAAKLGIKCELYEVEDKKNTHSWYTAGCFLYSRAESKTVDKFMSYVESL